MAGERDLRELLASLRPRLRPDEYVYVTVSGAEAIPAAARIDEDEAVTLVLPRTEADARGLEYEYVARWITLDVHSALDAVGLTAAFATVLADAGISCNVLAGYHHDHLLVDADRASEALVVLERLAASARQQQPPAPPTAGDRHRIMIAARRR